MTPEQIAGSIILLFCGAIPGLLLGYLIAVKENYTLIAGWDPAKISNHKAFARLLGYSVMALGAGILFIALAWMSGLVTENGMALLLAAVSALPLVAAIIGRFKYGKSADT